MIKHALSWILIASLSAFSGCSAVPASTTEQTGSIQKESQNTKEGDLKPEPEFEPAENREQTAQKPEQNEQPAPVKTEPVQLRLAVPESVQETGWWCGPAALQMVLGWYGIFVSQQELSDLMHTSPVTGTEYEDLARAATELIFLQTGRSGQYTAVIFTSADSHLRAEFEERAVQDLKNGSPVFASINNAVMYKDTGSQVHQTVIYGADLNEEGKAERWYYLDPSSVRTSEYGQKYSCTADEMWNAMLNNPEPGYVY
ncbi:MAG: C39 family peptidase [Erysipelotrichaceae bacterium]|nr:C39 family peptidase [Erysipelotrichaceae bacterium]